MRCVRGSKGRPSKYSCAAELREVFGGECIVCASIHANRMYTLIISAVLKTDLLLYIPYSCPCPCIGLDEVPSPWHQAHNVHVHATIAPHTYVNEWLPPTPLVRTLCFPSDMWQAVYTAGAVLPRPVTRARYVYPTAQSPTSNVYGGCQWAAS